LQASSGLPYSKKDISAAEVDLLDTFKWNLQITTIIDQIEYFLSQGILFSTDKINDYCLNYMQARPKAVIEPLQEVSNKANINVWAGESATKERKSVVVRTVEDKENAPAAGTVRDNRFQDGTVNPAKLESDKKTNPSSAIKEKEEQCFDEKNVYDFVVALEDSLINLANLILGEPEYLLFDKAALGAACLAFIRKINHITPNWSSELANLTGFTEEALIPHMDAIHRIYTKAYCNMITENHNWVQQQPAAAFNVGGPALTGRLTVSGNTQTVAARVTNPLQVVHQVQQNVVIDSYLIPVSRKRHSSQEPLMVVLPNQTHFSQLTVITQPSQLLF
jgi:hypothetical protein